ncbi:homeobox protein knotted-1-like 2 [Herrania umbratica]|uniref:Homeobox protein knotted-1-like 2 n=1 Tax=Herrania umbratica TaxID=108875 RepID=A0A6J1AYQ1_9ROSI|nr:homeobox protein knotted-1-like 2 [Herrania umbratica]
METKRNTSSGEKEEEEGEEEEELLKTRISSHPLYGRLVENHLNCLKVGAIADSGRNSKANQRKADYNPCSSIVNESELDLFMEAYCSALSKLKDAMEEPHQETIAFINGMHSQLRELARTNPQSADVFLATEMSNSNWSRDQQK